MFGMASSRNYPESTILQPLSPKKHPLYLWKADHMNDSLYKSLSGSSGRLELDCRRSRYLELA